MRSTPIGINPNPVSVTVDERTGRVFVVAQGPLGSKIPYPEPVGPGSVSILDAVTGRLLRRTRVGVRPLQAALDVSARRLYVLNQGALTAEGGLGPGSVSVLDAATGALVRTTPVGVGTVALAVDERRGRVFALALDLRADAEVFALDPETHSGATQISGTTSVLDAATGRLLRTLPGVSGTALAVNARAGRLLVASGVSCPPARDPNDPENPGCLGVYDEATGRRLASRPLSQTVDLRAMATDDLTSRTFAALVGIRTANDGRDVDHVIALDAMTGAPVRNTPLSDTPDVTVDAFVLSVTAGRVAVVTVPDGYQIQQGGAPAEVTVVETQGGRVLRTQTLRPLDGPYGFRTSAVIDARCGRIIVLAQPLATPQGTPDGPAVFNVLDARTGRLLHTTRGQPGDGALGLDAQGGHIFVANARSSTVRMLDVTRL